MKTIGEGKLQTKAQILSLAKSAYLQSKVRVKSPTIGLIQTRGKIKVLGTSKLLQSRGRIAVINTKSFTARAKLEFEMLKALQMRAKLITFGNIRTISARVRIRGIENIMLMTMRGKIKVAQLQTMTMLAKIIAISLIKPFMRISGITPFFRITPLVPTLRTSGVGSPKMVCNSCGSTPTLKVNQLTLNPIIR
jgi:hypothetical protein